MTTQRLTIKDIQLNVSICGQESPIPLTESMPFITPKRSSALDRIAGSFLLTRLGTSTKKFHDVGGLHQQHRAGRGSRENQPAHHARVTQGEFLRQRTAQLTPNT